MFGLQPGCNIANKASRRKFCTIPVLKISDLSDPILNEKLGAELANELREETEMMTGVYPKFNRDDYLNGEISPVFFGSAINNFGVKEMKLWETLKTLCE